MSDCVDMANNALSDHRSCSESGEWLYELKHDGFRALAHLNADRCRFVSRRGNEMKRFNELAAFITKEPKVKDAVLDGKVVALMAPAGPLFTTL